MIFFKCVKITIPKDFKSTAMNLILKHSLSYKKCEILDDLSIEIIISKFQKEIFEKIFFENSIVARFDEIQGVFRVFDKYKYRYGIFIGVIILLFSIYASSLFVWKIEIHGNKNISNEEILETLSKTGFSLGTFIPNIDYDELHNKFLINSNNISWISINISGNVARINVREELSGNSSKIDTYSNVVAKYDAQISEIRIFNGKKVASVGDVVTKGDLLVSGVLNSQSQGTRFVNANAIVFGYVNKSIHIEIPFQKVEKEYLADTYKEKSIKIFSKSIKFSVKGRNYGEFCDKIETTQKIKLFGFVELPIEIATTIYNPYEYKQIELTLKEIVDVAFGKLRDELDIAVKDADLISKSINTTYDDKFFYIDCDLYCLENIAHVLEFEVKKGE